MFSTKKIFHMDNFNVLLQQNIKHCWKTLFVTCLLLSYINTNIQAQNQPNIILLMADDLGWGDVGFNGGQVKTPNLDSLASYGIKFNRFYSGSAVCSPTRASCLTGRNGVRFGVYTANSGRLEEEEITIPELLLDVGYVSGHFGKWHLGTLTTEITDANRGSEGNTEEYSIPSANGYEEYFVTESKVPTYDPMYKPTSYQTSLGESATYGWASISDTASADKYGTRYWIGEETYATDSLGGDDSRVIMDRAIPFIEDAVAAETPFFTAIWIHTPHLPVVASEEHMALYSDSTHKQQLYYGSISAMDDQVGRLWDKLNELDIADNTMLCFCSDNGPEDNTPGSAGIYRDGKRSLYEGGVRVPAFCVYPNLITAGSETDFPCITSDYLPTIIDLLGITYPDDRPLDGISLLDVFNGETSTREESIGFIYGNQISWVDQQYKLISTDNEATYELYDLLNDEEEQTDLSDQDTVIVEQMKLELEEWNSSVTMSSLGYDYTDDVDSTAQDAQLKLYLPLDGTVEDMESTQTDTLTLVDDSQTANFVDEDNGAKLGQCLFFDADGNLPVYSTDTSFIDPNDGTDSAGFSVTFWFKWTDTYDTGKQIINQEDGTNSGKTFVNFTSNSDATYLNQPSSSVGGSIVKGTDATINDGEWHHISLVADTYSQTATFYIDGTAMDEEFYSSGGYCYTNDGAWRLFGNKTQTTSKTEMYIDELFIFDGVLTANQVAKLATNDYTDWSDVIGTGTTDDDGTTSVATINNVSQISVYPNITTGTVTVSGAALNAKYTVYSMTGVIAMQGILSDNTIDLSNLNNGVCFVKVEEQVFKIVLNK
jgi:arylsulfatase A-like enzyme